MAGPRRLECHAPVQLAVGTAIKLRRAAEMEIRMPRFAKRPAAIILFKVEKPLWSRGLLGFADLLGHVILPHSLLDCGSHGKAPTCLHPQFWGRFEALRFVRQTCVTPTVMGAISSGQLEL